MARFLDFTVLSGGTFVIPVAARSGGNSALDALFGAASAPGRAFVIIGLTGGGGAVHAELGGVGAVEIVGEAVGLCGAGEAPEFRHCANSVDALLAGVGAIEAVGAGSVGRVLADGVHADRGFALRVGVAIGTHRLQEFADLPVAVVVSKGTVGLGRAGQLSLY